VWLVAQLPVFFVFLFFFLLLLSPSLLFACVCVYFVRDLIINIYSFQSSFGFTISSFKFLYNRGTSKWMNVYTILDFLLELQSTSSSSSASLTAGNSHFHLGNWKTAVFFVLTSFCVCDSFWYIFSNCTNVNRCYFYFNSNSVLRS